MKPPILKIILGLLALALVPQSLLADETINSLAIVFKMVRQKNPEILKLPLLHQAAISDIRQANRSPNPKLELEMENYGGNSNDFEQSETTISVSREFELGDKRQSRTDIASSKKDILEQRAVISRNKILANAKRAYVRLLQRESLVKLNEEYLQQTTELVAEVKRMHSAGAILESAKTLAELELERIELQRKNSLAELNIARYQLSSFWGGDITETYQISGDLKTSTAKQYLTNIDLKNSPHLKLAKLNRVIAQQQFAMEKSKSIPNIELGVGYRRIEESETNTFLGTFSVDLPIANSNSDAIASAKQTAQATNFKEQAVLLKLEQQKSVLQLRLQNLVQQKNALATRLIASGEKALEQNKQAYRKGRVDIGQVLDSLQSLTESKKLYLDTLTEISNTTITIDELTGSIKEQL